MLLSYVEQSASSLTHICVLLYQTSNDRPDKQLRLASGVRESTQTNCTMHPFSQQLIIEIHQITTTFTLLHKPLLYFSIFSVLLVEDRFSTMIPGANHYQVL